MVLYGGYGAVYGTFGELVHAARIVDMSQEQRIAPANLAAQSLRMRRFARRVVPSGKLYKRKPKHALPKEEIENPLVS